MKCEKCGADLAGDTCACGFSKAQAVVDPMVKAYDDALTALTSFSKAAPPEKKDEEPPKKKEEDAPPAKEKDEEEDGEGGDLFEDEDDAAKAFASGLSPETQDAINAIPVLQDMVKAVAPLKALFGMAKAQARAEQFNALLAQAVVAQGEVIKSLTATLGTMKASLEKFGEQPAGRKGAINVFEKSIGGAAPEVPGYNGQELMAKAVQASVQGLIGPAEVGEVNAYVNRGMQVPGHLMAAINKAK